MTNTIARIVLVIAAASVAACGGGPSDPGTTPPDTGEQTAQTDGGVVDDHDAGTIPDSGTDVNPPDAGMDADMAFFGNLPGMYVRTFDNSSYNVTLTQAPQCPDGMLMAPLPMVNRACLDLHTGTATPPSTDFTVTVQPCDCSTFSDSLQARCQSMGSSGETCTPAGFTIIVHRIDDNGVSTALQQSHTM